MAFFSFLKSLAYRVFAPASGVRRRYAAFKELLEHDQVCHARMTRLEMIHHDRRPVDFSAVKRNCEEMLRALGRMVALLELMAPGRYPGLRDSVRAIEDRIAELLRLREVETAPPFVLTLEEVFSSTDMLVGGKARNLGVVRRELGLPVPKGFVITTRAFERFVQANGLRQKIDDALSNMDGRSVVSVETASKEITSLILQSPMPSDVETAIVEAYDRLLEGVPCAVRSSAAAEDSSISFAGIYKSVLGARKDSICSAYKEVVASKYSASALSYRIHHGLLDEETPMAALVLGMVDARASGIIYTADPLEGAEDRIVVYAVKGLGESLVGGVAAPDVFEVSKGDPENVASVCRLRSSDNVCHPRKGTAGDNTPLLSQEEPLPVGEEVAIQLARWGLDLESFFGYPLDVEWCQDRGGSLFLLQARPLGIQKPPEGLSRGDEVDVANSVLFSAGERASSGVGCGTVFKVLNPSQLDKVPPGSVLVAPTTSPTLVQVLERVKAVVTDTGSVAGHLASVAREWGIPALVNTHIATEVLNTGAVVTVDADGQRVLEGVAEALLKARESSGPAGEREESPFRMRLRRILEHVSRLSLTDPKAPNFVPEACRTVHDVLRFVHEKAVAEMFSLGEAPGRRMREAKRLSCNIPLVLYAVDLGDGFASSAIFHREIGPEQITSIPFQFLWQGMTEWPEEWDTGRVHVDWANLERMTSGEGIVSLDSKLLASFALVSRDYLNLNVRFGFHFTVLDTLCSRVDAENYISMRFEGGGGTEEGRSLRAHFIQKILEKQGFQVLVEGDSITASVARIPLRDCQDKLELMGRLLSVTRLLDMRLTREEQVDGMVADFEARSSQSRSHRKRSTRGPGGVDDSTAVEEEPTGYALTWITQRLAVGHAPTSYEDLESIREQGIDAVVNLCGEYCDLHQIEKDYGFEVLYLPIPDDEAPDMEKVERALAWLDEAVYLGKRVLIHCRLGIGRTGTFIRSYLLRRGFGPKLTEEKLQKIRSHPTSFNQWRFLRKYGKKEGRLTIREPSLEGENPVDLDPFFAEYENLCRAADQAFQSMENSGLVMESCGRDHDLCCMEPFTVQLVEAVYLYHHMNRELPREMRLRAIEQARAMDRILRARKGVGEEVVVAPSIAPGGQSRSVGTGEAPSEGFKCPLSFDGKCILYDQRPIRCRAFDLARTPVGGKEGEEKGEGGPEAVFPMDQARKELYEISRRLFLGLNGMFLEGRSLLFSVPHVVSGRFIQDYFTVLAGMGREQA
ncbi:MAG: hypothetical protein GX443_14470 [Deltaproteobacteria bacterium]|nr:hypothetical protein [Deltaproteobacteria bacterium]